MSRSSTVTQVGAPSPSAGSTTRWRIRGTIRDAHSWAATSRSQCGATSSSSISVTLERSRGSASLAAPHRGLQRVHLAARCPSPAGRRPARSARSSTDDPAAGRAVPAGERLDVALAHLFDVLVQLLDRPACGRDRRQHRDLHRAFPDRRRAAPHQLAGVADHDRHDRHARLHRDVERALLERAERGCRRPGALRRDDQRDALAQLAAPRARARPCGLRGVAAVDERDVGEPEHQPEAGDLRRLLLRHAGEPAAQQLGEDRCTSSWLWWLNRNTAGRVDQVLGAAHVQPRPRASAVPSSPPSESRGPRPRGGDPFSAPSADARAEPADHPGRAPPPCAPSRAPRPGRVARNRATGHPRSAAAAAEPGSGLSAARGRPSTGTARPRCRWSRRSSSRGRSRARARTPARRRPCRAPTAAARLGAPCAMPFSISTGVTSTCSTPIALAAGSTWNRVADEAKTTVCPALRWASTSRHASGIERAGDALHPQPLAQLGQLVLAAARPGPHAQDEERARSPPRSCSPDPHGAQAEQEHPPGVERRDVPARRWWRANAPSE